MQWLNQFQETIGLWMLRSKQPSQSTPKAMPSLNDAHHIAILYDATFIDKEPAIHRFVAQLKQEGKKVYTIGFVDMPKLPGNKKFSLQSDFVWREKMDIFKLPNKPAFETFVNTQFDLLINLYETPILTLMALSAWSTASCKIGPHIPNLLPFVDISIDMGTQPQLEHIIDQTNFYLRIIK